jgi:c-di-GMP-binding flagellar brake protein YcgR
MEGNGEEASPLRGEILDISADGMKIALSGSHPIALHQICRIRAGDPDATVYRLTGNVRWVDTHPLITVFGIQFDASA